MTIQSTLESHISPYPVQDKMLHIKALPAGMVTKPCTANLLKSRLLSCLYWRLHPHLSELATNHTRQSLYNNHHDRYYASHRYNFATRTPRYPRRAGL